MRAYIKDKPCDHSRCKELQCIKCDKVVRSCTVYPSNIRIKTYSCVCMLCHKNTNRNWRMNNANGQRRNWENRSLEVTVEDYDNRLKEQDGKCAICKQVCSTGRALAFDHNHKTMKSRGLLCFDCNVMIGKAKDNPLILAEAAAYLLKWDEH